MKKGVFGKLALLFVAVAWGSSMVVIKGSTDILPAGSLLAWRFTIATLVLGLVNIKRLKQIDKEYIKSGIFIGICLFMAYFTQTLGVMLEMPGKSHFLSSAYCVFVPFLGWIVLKERPKIYHIIAAVMCATGIVLVSLVGNFSISYGDSLSIISSVFWAAQIIAIAKWGNGKDPVLITILEFVVCAILAWAFTYSCCWWSTISWCCLFWYMFLITDNRTENRRSNKCFYNIKFRKYIRISIWSSVLWRNIYSTVNSRIYSNVLSYNNS